MSNFVIFELLGNFGIKDRKSENREWRSFYQLLVAFGYSFGSFFPCFCKYCYVVLDFRATAIG